MRGGLAVAAFQSSRKAINQALVIKGLAQEANCSSPQHLRPNPFLRICRDPNDWHVAALGDQAALQFDPAQT